MNILRWKRKSKKKIKFKTLILFIFSLIMTTFAWFAYSKVLNTTMNLHMASWNMEYYIGEDKKTNPIGINIDTLYPTMPEQTVTVDIKNNGEKLVDIEHQVLSVTIIGTSYEILYEGQTKTSDNYIVIAPSVLSTDLATGKAIYKNVITNDISKFPFTIEVEHSAQVAAGGQGYLKVIVNWGGDNNELDSEWGYRVGEYFANNPTATSAISVQLSIDSYQADPDGGELVETLPTTLQTAPYLPTGFTRVPGTSLDTGLVITDASGNEYVWVEVPKNTTVYDTAGINITAFSDEEYTKIENDLKAYSSAYNTRDDAYTSYKAIGLSDDNYKALKKNALKSIYQNGGFYIGRYETGIESSFRTGQSESTPTETPVIKANAYPFNYVTCGQAQEIANKKSTADYTNSLMFGFQWDLVMKYLETSSAVSGDEINTDSTSWGNYKNNKYNITKTNARYSFDNGATWSQVNSENVAYEKTTEGNIMLTTGSNSVFSKQNIYDLVGNMAEWTLNVVFNGSTPVGGNGGDYLADGTTSASHRSTTYDSTSGLKQVGFRIAMFSNVYNGAVGKDNSSEN